MTSLKLVGGHLLLWCRTEQQAHDLTYCLSLFVPTEKGLAKLQENFACYQDKLSDEVIFNHIHNYIGKAKKNGRAEVKVTIWIDWGWSPTVTLVSWWSLCNNCMRLCPHNAFHSSSKELMIPLQQAQSEELEKRIYEHLETNRTLKIDCSGSPILDDTLTGVWCRKKFEHDLIDSSIIAPASLMNIN